MRFEVGADSISFWNLEMRHISLFIGNANWPVTSPDF